MRRYSFASASPTGSAAGATSVVTCIVFSDVGARAPARPDVTQRHTLRSTPGRISTCRKRQSPAQEPLMKLDSSISAIVTGGASGLGGATVRALRAQGVKVAIFDMNEKTGTAFASETGAVYCNVNVTHDASV